MLRAGSVYLHNATPKDSVSPCKAPTNALPEYSIRIKGIDGALPLEPWNQGEGEYTVGEKVT